jgi:hypothetical protein
MEQSEQKNPFEDLSVSAKEYLNLKIDEYKLRGVEGLSTLFNTILFITVTTIVAGVALQLLGLAAGYAIGELIGSTSLGFCIIGGIFVIAVIILYAFRKKLFINQLIKIFIKLFFDNGQK